jgi:hypothetical protein
MRLSALAQSITEWDNPLASSLFACGKARRHSASSSVRLEEQGVTGPGGNVRPLLRTLPVIWPLGGRLPHAGLIAAATR